MSFASDRLYNGYLRRNMPTIVSKVKVREIITHLPCLTTHDRENIEAKRELSGNYDGMVLLLDCLRRRENWPEQFIQALEACEHTNLAAEIRQEYDSLRGVNNSSSGSAPTTVVRAHVHPTPAANHPPVSGSAVSGQATIAQPAETLPAPPEPAAQVPPPVRTPAQQQVPQITAVQASGAVSPPEPSPEPPQSTQDEVPLLPSTPPPSPAQVAEPLLLQEKTVPQQEPEENSESDIRDASGDTSLVPGNMSSEKKEAAVNVVTSPQQQSIVPHSETETSLNPDPPQTAAATNDKQQQCPSSTPINSEVPDGSSLLTLTPVKHPVQDTTPPDHKVPTAVLQPEKSPERAAAQIFKGGPQTEATASTSPELGTNRRDNFHEDRDDNTVCLSKPGHLISIQPDNHASPPVQASNFPLQPFSGNSERLEISEAASDAETLLPACTAVGPEVENATSAQPCQESGIAPDHSEPEENHYESPNQSFEVMENVVHVAEASSILNLDGQAPVPQLQIVNGEPAKGSFAAVLPSIRAADDTVSRFNSHRSESFNPPELEGAGFSSEQRPLPSSEKTKGPNSSDGQSTTKYILIATGVGVLACALLMIRK
ncbi:mitochondrial antiviral-signaling protein [Girardinichthys multiradiatus]|uniref:mitochondrial antiviral-signaling protein n=1 Tax=Girardinichthys multiradiatus TaxID=208333 RepID=UPI001FAB6E24|nr:mitochondrial antiviral-signaling protein [Girardinichthys multiradiatus]